MMMAYAKQKQLVNKLSQLTRASAIDWMESATHDAFQVSFRDNTVKIRIRPSSQATGSDDVEVQLINSSGELVESFTDVNLSSDSEDPPGHWYQLMLELHDAARRKALGVDKVIDDIMSDLNEIVPF
jgi:hypothetical protein